MKSKSSKYAFDGIEYNLSECKFNEHDELVLPDGTIITKDDYSKGSATFKLCWNTLKATGHVKCALCGEEATIIRRDKSPKNNTFFHWAFYRCSKHHGRILFTKDHIVPKSLTPKDTGTNIGKYQVACGPCNWNRGNDYNGMSDEERINATNKIKKEKWIREIFSIFLKRYMKICKYKDYTRGVFKKEIKSMFESKVKDYINTIVNQSIINSVALDLQSKLDNNFYHCFKNIAPIKNERFTVLVEQFKNLFYNDFQNIVQLVENK